MSGIPRFPCRPPCAASTSFPKDPVQALRARSGRWRYSIGHLLHERYSRFFSSLRSAARLHERLVHERQAVASVSVNPGTLFLQAGSNHALALEPSGDSPTATRAKAISTQILRPVSHRPRARVGRPATCGPPFAIARRIRASAWRASVRVGEIAEWAAVTRLSFRRVRPKAPST